MRAIVPSDVLRFSEVECLVALGRLAEADFVLAELMDASPEPELRSRAAAAREQLHTDHPAIIVVSTNSPLTIETMDGRLVEVSGGALEIEVAPGEHVWSAIRPGHARSERTFALAPGERVEWPVTLSPIAADVSADGARRRRAGTWVGASLAVGAVGLGAGALVAHQDSSGAVDRRSALLESEDPSVARVNALGRTAIDSARLRNALVGAASVSAVGSALGFALGSGRRSSEDAPVVLAPAIGATSLGVSARW